MDILLIEDEQGIAQFITQGLTEVGYQVTLAQDGEEGQWAMLAKSYDIIILDLMLPKVDGFQLLREIRNHDITSPVLILTARDDIQDRVKGLDLGADDYLVKPFDFSELLARLRALQRRPPLQPNTTLQVADLHMDLIKREVRRGDQLIELSPLEFKLLEYMMENTPQVLSRLQIGEHVWNFDYYHHSNVVDVYVGYLRRKIDRHFHPPLIHTVRGEGYCLRANP